MTADSLEPRLLLATFTVTSTADAGPGTLRQAILDANASPTPDTIDFNLPTTAAPKLAPFGELPHLTGTTTIDGTTQPGYAPGHLVVELTGLRGGAGATGLWFQGAPDSVVRGLIFNQWSGNAVMIAGGERVVVEGNWIGRSGGGTQSSPNGTGVTCSGVNCRIGGADPAAANFITGNTVAGVRLVAPGANNTVAGNSILGNPGFYGVGVSIEGSGGNTVGGTSPGARNVISSSLKAQVLVQGGAASGPAEGNRIQGNYIGTDPTGSAPTSELTGIGILIDGATRTLVGGADPGARNLISGTSVGVSLRGNANVVQGNFIGTDASGARELPGIPPGPLDGGRAPGNFIGILVDGAGFTADNPVSLDNLIGGSAPGEGNVISGNSFGVSITGAGAVRNTVAGNRIGTGADGSAAVPNRTYGIQVRLASQNVIGGDTPAARNVVSGNAGFAAGDGIVLDSAPNNLVRYNYVGTTADGAAALGNTGTGISVAAPFDSEADFGNVIEDNVVSGNRTGISVFEANANVLRRNTVGLDAGRHRALPNAAAGVSVTSDRNVIGGAEGGAGNVIAGNASNGTSGYTGDGIYLSGRDNLVQGNFIGYEDTTTDPPTAIGNGGSGITLIWEINRVVANTIAHNGGDGIRALPNGWNNELSRNSIFDNAGLGIDLPDSGVTPNSPLDAVTDYPVITRVESDGAATRIHGTLATMPGSSYVVEFFSNDRPDRSGHGEGQTFLGSVPVGHTGSGTSAFSFTAPPLAPGVWISATATRYGPLAGQPGYTSEFAADVVAPPAGDRGPRVTDVFVGRSNWSQRFTSEMWAESRGEMLFGFAVPGGAAQLAPLPWGNLNQVSIRFDEPAIVDRDDLAVRSASGALLGVVAFEYRAASRTATWVLASDVGADRLTLELNADGPTGVRDAAGNALDGEWSNGTDAFPSGDGASGGDFVFRVNVLPGDANRDGRVDATDLAEVRRRFGPLIPVNGVVPKSYSVFHDLDGSARITQTDLVLARLNQGRRLPAGTTTILSAPEPRPIPRSPAPRTAYLAR